jgi:hypothetical protein
VTSTTSIEIAELINTLLQENLHLADAIPPRGSFKEQRWHVDDWVWVGRHAAILLGRPRGPQHWILETHSTAGTWPCLYRLESDGPAMLDGGEYWGTLTIPMIQRRVSSVPPPTFAHLVPCFSLVHYAISIFQIYCIRHLSEVELDTMRPQLIFSMPFHSCFCLIHLLVMLTSCVNLLMSIPRIVFDFDFLFFIFCKLDVCVINLSVTMLPPSLERTRSLQVRDDLKILQ